MVITHKSRRGRKESGGRYKKFRGKRTFEKGSRPAETLITDRTKVVVHKTKGGGIKGSVVYADTANVLNPKTKKYEKAKIKRVLECPSNRQYVRRNIIVKGAVIDTDKGKAKVTSRPGQHGTVNAVLV